MLVVCQKQSVCGFWCVRILLFNINGSDRFRFVFSLVVNLSLIVQEIFISEIKKNHLSSLKSKKYTINIF